ncbi:hypothetical protein K1719_046746 [Acacia pycnantha]|nr:hypothetical protein K1719_046746 [Acacia pycnantha]
MRNPGQVWIRERGSRKAVEQRRTLQLQELLPLHGTPNSTLRSLKSFSICRLGWCSFDEAMYKVVSNMFVRGNYSQPPFSSMVDKKERQG